MFLTFSYCCPKLLNLSALQASNTTSKSRNFDPVPCKVVELVEIFRTHYKKSESERFHYSTGPWYVFEKSLNNFCFSPPTSSKTDLRWRFGIILRSDSYSSWFVHAGCTRNHKYKPKLSRFPAIFTIMMLLSELFSTFSLNILIVLEISDLFTISIVTLQMLRIRPACILLCFETPNVWRLVGDNVYIYI